MSKLDFGRGTCPVARTGLGFIAERAAISAASAAASALASYSKKSAECGRTIDAAVGGRDRYGISDCWKYLEV